MSLPSPRAPVPPWKGSASKSPSGQGEALLSHHHSSTRTRPPKKEKCRGALRSMNSAT